MKKTAMIVEDATFLRIMMRNMLTHGGFDVVAEATNGVAGLTNFYLYKPDIILLDIIMTEMDGLTMLDEITKNMPNAKIVMCSALGHIDLVLSCLAHGASGYVLKPFQEETLLSVVNSAFDDKPVFNKNTIEQYLQNGIVKIIIEKRHSLNQDSINKLIHACTLDEPIELYFLSSQG